ncbi:MAG TPA: hypothetical protein VFH48_29805 [Chloroflexota bacterium]|nr:hypothetical protein [Chloroflexota bacterium]
MFTPGQSVQISTPPVLAPSDDQPAAPAPAASARFASVWESLRRWESSAALLLISTVYSLIQGATQNIIGIDGYYHVKVALLMREQGWRLLAPLDFPWLQLTILGPGRYTDHHFLFHVLQTPFTFGDLRIGAKMAAVLFAVVGLYTTYLFLARLGVRYPFLWIAALLACAPIFLWRQSMARTQSLSLLLIVLGLWALFAGRPRLLLPIGFAAAWLFNGFFFVIGAPLAAVLVSLTHLAARRWWLRDCESEGPRLSFAVSALAWTLFGLGLGLLLHPYFPRNVEFAFFHLLPKAVPADQGTVTVGQEWYPYSFNGFLVRVGPSATLTALGLVPIFHQLARRRWPDWRSLVLGILALGFLTMVARSQRLIEYYPAFAVIFCAWSWSHAPATIAALAGLARFSLSERMYQILGRLRPVVPWLIAVALVPSIVTSTLIASREADDGADWNTYRDGALWLARNTPAGSRVFTTGWDDFPQMFFWNTHNTYLVGLDPTYTSLDDPERYQLWRSITQGRVMAPSKLILEQFGASYILSDLRHERFLQMADADPGLERVLRTRTVAIYRVRGG